MHTQDVDCRQCNRPEETMEGTFYPPPVAAIKGFESNLLYRKKEKSEALVQLSILLSFVMSALFQHKG